MSLVFLASWAAVMVPLVVSPGPANVVFAASGAQFGLRRSLPLMAGIDLVFVVKSVAVGLGAGGLVTQFPAVYHAFRVAGALYLLYLAYTFLKPAFGTVEVPPRPLTFRDGVTVQCLNPKGWLLVIVMFSLFGGPTGEGSLRTAQLVVMLATLNVTAHVIWILAGAYLVRVISTRFHKAQAWVFGGSLVAVALWILMDPGAAG